MATEQQSSNPPVVDIRASHGLRWLDLRELWRYRDLFYFLVWRDIKVRYAQSILGIGWAVIHPLAFMIVFTVVFGMLVKMRSDGAPYALFSYTGLVAWTFFSTALTTATDSLIRNSDMLTKIYFPRVLMPVSAVVGKLVDFTIALTLLFVLMAWYGTAPTLWGLALPFLIVLMVITASGLGLWLGALAVLYRDVQYSLTFMLQLLMYAAPVVYPASLVPDQWRVYYALNPMVGVVEGFRSALLDTNPMPWDLIVVGSISASLIAVTGVFFFRRTERIFADVV